MREEEGEQVGVWPERNAFPHKMRRHGNTGVSVI